MTESSRPLPDPTSATVESRPGLLRALGPGMAVAIVVGNVIGSGIFFKPGGIARDVGEFWTIMACWLAGGAICLLGALSFAELGAMLPQSGGLYVYLREAYGRPVAFLQGWIEFVFGKPGSISALSVAFVGTLAGQIPGWSPDFTDTIVISIAVITFMSWINIMGVIWGGRMQAGTTWIKAGFLGVLALLPFVLLLTGKTGADPANYSSTIAPAMTGTAAKLAAAMLAVMWAYNGWHEVTPVAEEVRDPQRNIPFSLLLGVGILTALYVAANFAYHGVLTMDEMATAQNDVPNVMLGKLLSPFDPGLVRFGQAFLAGVICCSLFGAINANILGGPRTSFAMGRDDLFFRQLGKVHVNYRTPVIAIVVQGIMSVLLIVGTAAYVKLFAAPPPPGSNQLGPVAELFGRLTNFVVFSASLFYVLAVLSLIVLRVKHPDWERPYRTIGYPLTPLLYLVFYGWFLWQVYWSQPFEAHVSLLLVALGIPVYYAWQHWARRHPEDMTDGV